MRSVYLSYFEVDKMSSNPSNIAAQLRFLPWLAEDKAILTDKVIILIQELKI